MDAMDTNGCNGFSAKDCGNGKSRVPIIYSTNLDCGSNEDDDDDDGGGGGYGIRFSGKTLIDPNLSQLISRAKKFRKVALVAFVVKCCYGYSIGGCSVA
ncbi:hypothetical protein LguiA_022291 [Lonicera macranthoides]